MSSQHKFVSFRRSGWFLPTIRCMGISHNWMLVRSGSLQSGKSGALQSHASTMASRTNWWFRSTPTILERPKTHSSGSGVQRSGALQYVASILRERRPWNLACWWTSRSILMNSFGWFMTHSLSFLARVIPSTSQQLRCCLLTFDWLYEKRFATSFPVWSQIRLSRQARASRLTKWRLFPLE